jgi:hypothetical protein
VYSHYNLRLSLPFMSVFICPSFLPLLYYVLRLTLLVSIEVLKMRFTNLFHQQSQFSNGLRKSHWKKIVCAQFQATSGNMHSMSICWNSSTLTASITRLQSLEIIFFGRMYGRLSLRWRKNRCCNINLSYRRPVGALHLSSNSIVLNNASGADFAAVMFSSRSTMWWE